MNTQSALVDPYQELRDKIVELDPEGQEFIAAFEKTHAGASFSGHGAAQKLIRTFIAQHNGMLLSRLVDWGFSSEPRADQLQCDFEVTTTPDQLIRAGFCWKDLDPEIGERIWDKDHFTWRQDLAQCPRN